tara:strand:- start:423 stop:668 length:246 start_codon:yes stop_codon:yes gene_type:complete
VIVALSKIITFLIRYGDIVIKTIRIINNIFFNDVLKKVNRYNKLKIIIAIYSPLNNISSPDIKEKIIIDKMSLFLVILKKK